MADGKGEVLVMTVALVSPGLTKHEEEWTGSAGSKGIESGRRFEAGDMRSLPELK
jgi:hypothetical protein